MNELTKGGKVKMGEEIKTEIERKKPIRRIDCDCKGIKCDGKADGSINFTFIILNGEKTTKKANYCLSCATNTIDGMRPLGVLLKLDTFDYCVKCGEKVLSTSCFKCFHCDHPTIIIYEPGKQKKVLPFYSTNELHPLSCE